MKLIKSINYVDAIFISKYKKVYATEGIRDGFIFVGEEEEFSYISEEM